jgi:hypothetical protein
MSRLLSLAVCGFAAVLLAAAAQASGDATQQSIPRKAERDKRQGKERIPAQRKDPEARGSASTGASVEPAAAGGTDLGAKADKEDEEFRKKQGSRGH